MNQTSKVTLLIATFIMSTPHVHAAKAAILEESYGLMRSISSFDKVKDLSTAENFDGPWGVLDQSNVVSHPEACLNERHKRPESLPKMLAGYNLAEVIEAAEIATLAYYPMSTPAERDLYKDYFNFMDQHNSDVMGPAARGSGIKGNQKGTIIHLHPFGTEKEQSGFIAEMSDGRVYVSYKGTDSLRNMATNAWGTFAYDSLTGHRCHNGIMKGFYRTKDQVFNILEGIAQRNKGANKAGATLEALLRDKVVATGHSLGSGLKDMFIAYVQSQYKVSAAAIGFAGPRVFDTVSAQEIMEGYAGKTRGNLRVWQKGDPVPIIAFGLLGYKHIHSASLELPNIGVTALHIMKGYTDVLNAMLISPNHTVFARRLTGEEVRFGFEPTKSTGIMQAKTIKHTRLPNPLHYLGKVRQATVTYIDRPIHTVVKTVVRGAIMKPSVTLVKKAAGTLTAAWAKVKK
jgi:Lipase (class 3)